MKPLLPFPYSSQMNLHSCPPVPDFTRLIDVIRAYPPSAPWSWSHLSSSPRIFPIDVQNYPQGRWVKKYLCHNPNFTVAIIMANSPQSWPVEELCCNPATSAEEIITHFGHLIPTFSTYQVAMLSRKPMTIPFIRANLHLLDMVALSRNTHITIHDILANRDLPWNQREVSQRRDITEAIVLLTHPFNWRRKMVAKYGMVSNAFVRTQDEDLLSVRLHYNANLNVTERLELLNTCINIFPGFINNIHPLSRADFEQVRSASSPERNHSWWIAGSPDLTHEYIESHPGLFTDETSGLTLSSNPIITIDFVQRHPEIKWETSRLCRNVGIPIFHSAWELSWYDISRRADITPTLIMSHINSPWDLQSISVNNTSSRNLIVRAVTHWQTYVSRDTKVSHIQRWWRHHCYRVTRPARIDRHGRVITGFEGFARNHLFNRAPVHGGI